YDKSFIDVASEVFGKSPAELEADLSADELAQVTGKHAVDAIASLTRFERARMRDIEAAFERDHAPWASLRYFSSEEDADDTSVLVLRGTKFQPAAIAAFFVSLMAGDVGVQCQNIVDKRAVPPYGIDLSDEHHGTCWRAYH